MDLTVISNAIYARIQADTGSGGLWLSAGTINTAVIAEIRYAIATPSVPVFPYVVWELDWDDDYANFTGDGAMFMATFTIRDMAARGWDRISVIVNRLIGDAMLASGNRNVPTYGFNRHRLVLATDSTNPLGMKTDAMRWVPVGGNRPTDENYLEAVLAFRGLATTQAVNE